METTKKEEWKDPNAHLAGIHSAKNESTEEVEKKEEVSTEEKVEESSESKEETTEGKVETTENQEDNSSKE